MIRCQFYYPAVVFFYLFNVLLNFTTINFFSLYLKFSFPLYVCASSLEEEKRKKNEGREREKSRVREIRFERRKERWERAIMTETDRQIQRERNE